MAAGTDGCTNDCETNPKIDVSGCGRSEGASSTSTPTCIAGRLSALVHQSCGRGLFAAYDPGFNDDPRCGATTTASTGGVGRQVLPQTGLRHVGAIGGMVIALLAVLAAALAGVGVRGRRRQSRS